MRNFLVDKTIVGAMLVSRCGDILNYTIPEMLRWADWMLIVFDNHDRYTMDLVSSFQDKYPGRIRIGFTGLRPIEEKKETEKAGLYKRFNSLQGEARERLLDILKEYMRAGMKIDMVIWMDSDEFLSNHSQETLIWFAEHPEKKSIIMNPIFPFGDMRTIIDVKQVCHMRIFKPELSQSILPYRGLCQVNGITKPFKQMFKYGYVHLSYFTKEKREWRLRNWRSSLDNVEKYQSMQMWTIEKDAIDMTPEDIRLMYARKPDLTVKDYLIKHNLGF